jgi:hypothetical protein
MAGYTKEFLIAAYMSRFIKCNLITIDQLVALETQADKFYDKVGRDKFRVYASLDAEAIRLYKQTL